MLERDRTEGSVEEEEAFVAVDAAKGGMRQKGNS